MEPGNMTPPPEADDARLDAILRRPAPALPDDGFYMHALAPLPPPRLQSMRRLRTAQCFARAAPGALIALIGSTLETTTNNSWTTVVAAFAPVVDRLIEPAVLAALVVAVRLAIYALWPTRRHTTA